ncbi:MAG: hypothetical protein LBB50_04685 [Oscillospiraceae bacterium]|nr:hypothetical protein [Oscillospiraceae bacterium]
MDTLNSIVDVLVWIANAGTSVMEVLNKGLAYLPKIIPVFEKIVAFFSGLSEGGSFDLSSITSLF